MVPSVAPWIRTVTGRKINPLDVRIVDLDIEEMAHGLANVNRFTGNTREPLNVAQHSVYVSRLAEVFYAQTSVAFSRAAQREVALQGLVHDGSDYILNDISKWLKHSEVCAAFREAEDAAQTVVYRWAGVPSTMHPCVKRADDFMVRVEAEFAWGPFWSDVPGYGPLTDEERAPARDWHPWSWQKSKHAFLDRFNELT